MSSIPRCAARWPSGARLWGVTVLFSLAAWCVTALGAAAAVRIDEDAFGKSLGGWSKRDRHAAEYPLSGATYRTYKPEISPTPDGGIFISVRIDHVRSWLASDDHAMLEVTLNSNGLIVSARSSIAIQGRSISSDMIFGGNETGKQLLGADRAVQIGTDLVADLSSKLLREKIVEAGRVSFPAAIRHNYNLLFQSIRTAADSVPSAVPVQSSVPDPLKDAAPAKEATPAKAAAPAQDAAPAKDAPVAVPVPDHTALEIKPYASAHLASDVEFAA